MRALLSVGGATWVAATDDVEPWRFGETMLSRVIRVRGDLERLASELERGPKASAAADDWLYTLDPTARTLRIERDGAEFLTLAFNARGRSSPVSIERPAAPWGDLPIVQPPDPGAISAFVAEHFGDRLTQVRGAARQALASRLDQDETRVVLPPRPDAAYVRIDLGERALLAPSPAWRDAVGWRNRSPNDLTIWRPPHVEQVLDLSPSRFAKDLEPFMKSGSELTFALIAGAHVARGGKGVLNYVHAPLPERVWTVVEKGGDPERHIAQKDKRIKKKKLAVGARFARDVDCPGWQWVLLDWLASGA